MFEGVIKEKLTLNFFYLLGFCLKSAFCKLALLHATNTETDFQLHTAKRENTVFLFWYFMTQVGPASKTNGL